MPFTFGLTVIDVYDNGSIFDPSMLDITDEVLTKHLQAAIKNIASLSLATKFPTVASAPHLLVTAYKNLLSVGLACEEFSFPAVDKIKELFKNPVAFAPVAAATSGNAAAAPSKVESKKEEEEEEEEEMGFGLFD